MSLIVRLIRSVFRLRGPWRRIKQIDQEIDEDAKPRSYPLPLLEYDRNIVCVRFVIGENFNQLSGFKPWPRSL